MDKDPRWHGWATTANVMEMVREMIEFLKINSPEDFIYLCQFMTYFAKTAEK